MSENDCDGSTEDERLIVGGRLYVRADMSGLDFSFFRQLQQVRPHVLRYMLERDDRRDKALKLVAGDLAKRMRASDCLTLMPWTDPRGSISGGWREDPANLLPMDLPEHPRRVYFRV